MISTDPGIQEICRLNWRFLEYEDRVSEATYIFIVALRTLPTNTGFFWHEYQNVLMHYMQNLKKEYQQQTCWLKLDAPVRSKTINDYSYSLVDLLIAREPDCSEIAVHSFLNTLPKQQQDILNLLMDGRSHRSVCKRIKISSHELKQHLNQSVRIIETAALALVDAISKGPRGYAFLPVEMNNVLEKSSALFIIKDGNLGDLELFGFIDNYAKNKLLRKSVDKPPKLL